MNILVLHGPNLNLLGEREPDVYGRLTLDEVNARIFEHADGLGACVRVLQSNHEGVLIDKLHDERHWMDGAVLNLGAYTHTSYALRDAIVAVGKPCVEVHLSDIERREEFRKVSVIADVAAARHMGHGVQSYLDGIDALRVVLAGERGADEGTA